MRANMVEFLPKLKERFWRIDKNNYLRTEGQEDELIIEGREGLLAMIDDIDEKLRNEGKELEAMLSKRHPFYWSNAMALASKEYCDFLIKEGKITKTGPQERDIDTVDTFLQKYGGWRKYFGINVMVGRANTASDVIEAMFIDDGDKQRGSRDRIWNKVFKKTGVATCDSEKFGTVTVITYAYSYVPNHDTQAKLEKLYGTGSVSGGTALAFSATALAFGTSLLAF